MSNKFNSTEEKINNNNFNQEYNELDSLKDNQINDNIVVDSLIEDDSKNNNDTTFNFNYDGDIEAKLAVCDSSADSDSSAFEYNDDENDDRKQRSDFNNNNLDRRRRDHSFLDNTNNAANNNNNKFESTIKSPNFTKSICSDDSIFNYDNFNINAKDYFNYYGDVKKIEENNSSSSAISMNVIQSQSDSIISKLVQRSDTSHTNTSNKKITINVGGIRYETYHETLKTITDSRLANLSKTNSDYDPIRNEYFFDRHPSAFLAILNYFRTGKLHAPLDMCANLFYEELNYWGINEYLIEPCCWTHYEKLRTVILKDDESNIL